MDMEQLAAGTSGMAYDAAGGAEHPPDTPMDVFPQGPADGSQHVGLPSGAQQTPVGGEQQHLAEALDEGAPGSTQQQDSRPLMRRPALRATGDELDRMREKLLLQLRECERGCSTLQCLTHFPVHAAMSLGWQHTLCPTAVTRRSAWARNTWRWGRDACMRAWQRRAAGTLASPPHG
jgi:hypothetical protein